MGVLGEAFVPPRRNIYQKKSRNALIWRVRVLTNFQLNKANLELQIIIKRKNIVNLTRLLLRKRRIIRQFVLPL